jgi:hypothetical protein
MKWMSKWSFQARGVGRGHKGNVIKATRLLANLSTKKWKKNEKRHWKNTALIKLVVYILVLLRGLGGRWLLINRTNSSNSKAASTGRQTMLLHGCCSRACYFSFPSFRLTNNSNYIFTRELQVSGDVTTAVCASENADVIERISWLRI